MHGFIALNEVLIHDLVKFANVSVSNIKEHIINCINTRLNLIRWTIVLEVNSLIVGIFK